MACVPIAYAAFYRNFDSPLMRQIRREAYGEDIGQHSFVTAAELRADLERLRLGAASRLLDLGCGPGGPLLVALAHTGCNGIGIELSEEALAAGHARAAVQGLGDRLSLRQGNLDKPLPFAVATFDAAMSLDVVLHLHDRGAFFREVARVIAPGARFLLVDAGIETGTLTDDERRRRSVHGPLQFVPPGRNDALLIAAGLRLIETEDRTASILKNACGRLAAIRAHRAEFEQVFGAGQFNIQVTYLETVIDLAERRLLSRFAYLVERP